MRPGKAATSLIRPLCSVTLDRPPQRCAVCTYLIPLVVAGVVLCQYPSSVQAQDADADAGNAPPAAASPASETQPPAAAPFAEDSSPSSIREALERLAPEALAQAVRTLQSNVEEEKLEQIGNPSLQNRLKVARATEWLLYAEQLQLRHKIVQAAIDIHNSLDLHVHARFVEPKLYVSLTPILRGNRRSKSVPTVQLPCTVESWCVDDQDQVVATGLKLPLYCSGDLMLLRDGSVPSDVLANADDEPFPTIATNQGASLVFVPDRKTARYRELKKQHAELETVRRRRMALEALVAEVQADADASPAEPN